MSSGPKKSWSSVLEEKQHLLASLVSEGYEVPDGPFEREKNYLDAFEELCKQQKINISIRASLGYSYLDTYDHIMDIVRGVFESAPDLRDTSPPESLESLICRLVLAILKHGCDKGLKLLDLVKRLAELNKPVPDFSADIHRFPGDDKVQYPLQELYTQYFDSHVEILKALREEKTENFLEGERLKQLIDHNGIEIEAARARYDEQVNQAIRRENSDTASFPHHREGKGENIKFSLQAKKDMVIRYDIGDVLGRGSYGQVFQVQEQSMGSSYACKRIHFDTGQKCGLSEEEVTKKVLDEIRIMKTLHHHHIVQLAASFQIKAGFALIINPAADYNLRHFFVTCDRKKYHESYTRRLMPWFGCLLDALAFTHKKEIRHRDIKPSNILIKDNVVYFCDFGLAKSFSGSDSASGGSKPEGTLEYRAPENVTDQSRGRLADVFSLGCVFSEMFTVRHGKSIEDYREHRQKDSFRECLPEVKEWLCDFHENPLLRDTIINMLIEDPSNRYSAQRALSTLTSDHSLRCLDCWTPF